MFYKKMLEDGYAASREEDVHPPPENRLEFLSKEIFGFTTDDGAMDEFFGRKAVEVCKAISRRTTYDYISNPADYVFFLLMLQVPFFADRINYGVSIRAAFWDNNTFAISGSWIAGDGSETLELLMDHENWLAFIDAVIEFAAPEMQPAVNGLVADPDQEK